MTAMIPASTPASFGLYDALELCASAIGEADGGAMPEAMASWTAARAAAAGVTADTAVVHALGLILAAAAPSHDGAPWRPALRESLDCASLACLLAADGDLDTAGGLLLDATMFATELPYRPAVRVILTAIWDGSQTEVAA